MTSPEIANVLKKYVTSKPLRFGGPLSGNKQTRQNRKDFEELQALALKDMDAFILFVMPPLLGYGIYLLMKNDGKLEDFVQLIIGYAKRIGKKKDE